MFIFATPTIYCEDVVHRCDCGGVGAVGAGALSFDDAEREDFHIPADAGAADGVIADCADDSCDVGAVAYVVHGVVVRLEHGCRCILADEIPPPPVVHLAVGVVIEAVGFFSAAGLARVRPDRAREVWVGVVHAGIHDGDDGAAGCESAMACTTGASEIGSGACFPPRKQMEDTMSTPSVAALEIRILRLRFIAGAVVLALYPTKDRESYRGMFGSARSARRADATSLFLYDEEIARQEWRWHIRAMSIEAMEREIAELKQRLEKVEAKVQPSPSQRWRAVVGSVKPNELTREAARLGAEWRAEENARR